MGARHGRLGLLCAIASSPEPVPQAEWLPIVVGGEPTMFDDASSHQRLLSLLSKHADDVGRDLRAGTYAPIFWPKAPEGMPSVASPWCSGYSRGIALREKAWAPMFKDEHMRSLLIPILGLAIPLHSKDPAPPAKRDRKVLERSIPACANMIFSYRHEGWRPSADRSPAPEATVHRLKIALLGVKPQVWRRVELASGAKLPTVSRVLLAAMGWLDYHLHEFVVGGTHIGTESRDFPRGVLSERNRTLDEIAPSTGDRFDFEYDFGDGWRHRVTVEAIVPAETGVSYPRCVAGARACPPEDCGGIGGYEQFLEAIADPENEQHDSMLGWAGGSFDPTAFDMESVNKRLRRFSRKARSL